MGSKHSYINRYFRLGASTYFAPFFITIPCETNLYCIRILYLSNSFRVPVVLAHKYVNAKTAKTLRQVQVVFINEKTSWAAMGIRYRCSRVLFTALSDELGSWRFNTLQSCLLPRDPVDRLDRHRISYQILNNNNFWLPYLCGWRIVGYARECLECFTIIGVSRHLRKDRDAGRCNVVLRPFGYNSTCCALTLGCDCLVQTFCNFNKQRTLSNYNHSGCCAMTHQFTFFHAENWFF